MGFSGQYGRGIPSLSVREVALVAMERVNSKRDYESLGMHQADAHGGPRISA